MANAIFQYPQQHGNFNSVEEVKKIMAVMDEFYNKIITLFNDWIIFILPVNEQTFWIYIFKKTKVDILQERFWIKTRWKTVSKQISLIFFFIFRLYL